jgi:HAMP domain-containing protein
MDLETPEDERFPRRYAAFFGVGALGLIGVGVLLWLPARGGPSTATSDLGLALLGGGLALIGGLIVALVVYAAERRFDRALRRREEAAERESLKLSLSMTTELAGVDLRGRDYEARS